MNNWFHGMRYEGRFGDGPTFYTWECWECGRRQQALDAFDATLRLEEHMEEHMKEHMKDSDFEEWSNYVGE